jgi:hypothetical protein
VSHSSLRAQLSGRCWVSSEWTVPQRFNQQRSQPAHQARWAPSCTWSKTKFWTFSVSWHPPLWGILPLISLRTRLQNPNIGTGSRHSVRSRHFRSPSSQQNSCPTA